jgi:hypothetical protein
MRTLPVFFIAFLLALTLPAHAQHDGAQERTSLFLLNYNTSPVAVGTDSVETITLPSHAVVERVVWVVDSAVTGTDSLTLRVSETQEILSVCHTGTDGGTPAAMQTSEPVALFEKSATLRIITDAAETVAGRVRVFIFWHDLN